MAGFVNEDGGGSYSLKEGMELEEGGLHGETKTRGRQGQSGKPMASKPVLIVQS